MGRVRFITIIRDYYFIKLNRVYMISSSLPGNNQVHAVTQGVPRPAEQDQIVGYDGKGLV